MFSPFSHFVSYGATDQETIRELVEEIDGLLVPGTVAAFQRQGTGGFVLTLSATESAPNYVIDPRFPLFQGELRDPPKASHEALADLLGAPELATESRPRPEDYSSTFINDVARHWVEFNLTYRNEAMQKFAKYSRRLDHEVLPPDRSEPLHVLPPYLVSGGAGDDLWRVTKAFFDATNSLTESTVRVVAAEDVTGLRSLLEDVSDERVTVWVNGLDELDAPPSTLASYALTVQEALNRGTSSFALYGGFFSVLLATFGLAGSSHGIGFGEYRRWIELPRSGPPPRRYYLPKLHRYVTQELAHRLWTSDSALTGCDCVECLSAAPAAMTYHSLMKHSVRCRAREIDEWAGLEPGEALESLGNDFSEFQDALDDASLPAVFASQVERSGRHMPRWIEALGIALDSD